MRVILFGATGMIGQGVLRECLIEPRVEHVAVVGRTKCEVEHEKITEIIHGDFSDYSAIRDRLAGYDTCFFCLGVSSGGMSEVDYTRITYDFTLAAAETLVELNPEMTFCYISGAGTDSTEKGRSMWARVKGRTENALLALPFPRSYMFRPALIRPMHGIKSKTRSYRIMYTVSAPVLPLLGTVFPSYVTTTEKLGRAMLAAVLDNHSESIIENDQINALADG